jgi:hypothetical protein
MNRHYTPTRASDSETQGLFIEPYWEALGVDQGGEYGAAVATAGDTDGNGFDDIIVSAPKETVDNEPKGKVYVYYGSAGGLDAAPPWTAVGPNQGSEFGRAVSSAGDVNNDGYADMIVGAPEYKNGDAQANEGAAFAFLGSPGGLSDAPDWSFESNRKDARLGSSVGGAGDVDDDGYDDVIVGAPGSINDLEPVTGAIYVFWGSGDGLSATPNQTVTMNNALLGAAVGAAGDVNGDGVADVVVGAPGYESGSEHVGAVLIFHGAASMGISAVPNTIITGTQVDGDFGAAAGAAGDVNDDGFDDIIVGAPGYDHATDGLINVGAAFVFFGSSTGVTITQAWMISGTQDLARLGAAVGAAGDVNNDGFDEVIVGSPGYSGDQALEGAIFVFKGSSSGPSPTFDWMAESNQGSNQFIEFGSTCGTAGDVNGDDSADVIAGAPFFKHATNPYGKAFVYRGSSIDLDRFLYLPLVLRTAP